MYLQQRRYRWVWSPLENVDGVMMPLVRTMVHQWLCPDNALHNAYTLTYCMMDKNQFNALKQDARFIVLPSLHDNSNSVHKDISTGLQKHGVTPNMTSHQLLAHLGNTKHPDFEPEI